MKLLKLNKVKLKVRKNEDYGKRGNNSNIMRTIVRRCKRVYPIFDWKQHRHYFKDWRIVTLTIKATVNGSC